MGNILWNTLEYQVKVCICQQSFLLSVDGLYTYLYIFFILDVRLYINIKAIFIDDHVQECWQTL